MLKIYSKSAKKVFEISSITDGEVTISQKREGTPAKLDFSLLKEGGISYHEGDKIEFSYNGDDIFSGYVFKKEKSDKIIKTTAYDQLIYLKQNRGNYNFSGVDVGKRIKTVSGEFNLIAGSIANTGAVLADKLYKEKSLLEIITDSVQRTNVQTGKIYVFYDDFGKLTLKESKDLISKIMLSKDGNIESYNYTTSLEESYNRVTLVQKNKKSGAMDAYIVKDDASESLWGRLQYFEEVDENLNPAQIKEKAERLFKFYGQKRRKLRLSTLGISEVRAGCLVFLDIPNLGDISLSKVLLVESVTHRFSAGGHTMDLEMEIYNDG